MSTIKQELKAFFFFYLVEIENIVGHSKHQVNVVFRHFFGHESQGGVVLHSRGKEKVQVSESPTGRRLSRVALLT